jgi:hypothetical protein
LIRDRGAGALHVCRPGIPNTPVGELEIVEELLDVSLHGALQEEPYGLRHNAAAQGPHRFCAVLLEQAELLLHVELELLAVLLASCEGVSG